MTLSIRRPQGQTPRAISLGSQRLIQRETRSTTDSSSPKKQVKKILNDGGSIARGKLNEGSDRNDYNTPVSPREDLRLPNGRLDRP